MYNTITKTSINKKALITIIKNTPHEGITTLNMIHFLINNAHWIEVYN
jgi:hypothetical protein